jgi:hypothetical protein
MVDNFKTIVNFAPIYHLTAVKILDCFNASYYDIGTIQHLHEFYEIDLKRGFARVIRSLT